MDMDNGIRVEQLSKNLTVFKLENINFSLKQGYVLGLIGRNGAGKTTLLNTILGLWLPEEGRIQIGEYDRVTEDVRAKDEIAFILDESILPTGMSPYGVGKLFQQVYTKFNFPHYKKLCRRFGLPWLKSMRKMSKGMVIKLQLALAFSREAKLYVFDEPSAGLDPVFRKEFVDYIFELMQDGKKTVIFSTHLTDELDRIADYILFLEKGQQILFEQKEELMSHYKLLRGSRERIEKYGGLIIGTRFAELCSEALVKLDKEQSTDKYSGNTRLSELHGELQIVTPTIEDIMYYFLKGTVA